MPKPSPRWGRVLLRLGGTLALLPVLLSVLMALFRAWGRMDLSRAPLWWFLGGMVLYFILHLFFWKPVFLYVVSHELTHALWAKFFGGSVKELHVSDSGGRVTVNRSNFLINLAPYFFPLYVLAALGLDLVAQDRYHNYVLVLLGLTLGLHLVLTAGSLHESQPDLTETGFVFSFVFIILINAGLLCAVFWRVDPQAFSPGTLHDEFVGELYLMWGWATGG